MSTVKFKRDTAFRKRFFVPDSFAHPAKMDAQLLIWIVEKYTKVNDVILDPMFGMGTTMLACMLGRDVIGVELEQKFVDMALKNWEVVKMHPQLGYSMGTCQIIQGDARQLEKLQVDRIISSPPYGNRLSDVEVKDGDPQRMSYRQALGKCDAIVTSPPYAETLSDKAGGFTLQKKEPEKGLYKPYSKNTDNISNLPYGNIDAVITSPPYGAEPTVSKKYLKIRTETGRDITKPSSQYHKYSDKVDAVITSPPYEGSLAGKDDESRAREFEKLEKLGIKVNPDSASNLSRGTEYSKSENNIGNLKGDTYLQAMLEVYQGCFRVLKPQGIMVLVVKPFIRNQKLVPLQEDTKRLCEQAGFSFVEEHHRILPSRSFWRVIYAKRFPDAPKIDYEYVLVFKKDGEL